MQKELALIGRMDGPSAVSTSAVNAAKTYREAVRLAWQMRRVKEMTRSMLAALAELYAPHVTDYLNSDDKPSRRDLPADAIARFEAVVGNTLVSQWLAGKSGLTVLEEMQENRRAA